MTVQELIEQLKNYPPDAKVMACQKGWADVFHEIEFCKPELHRKHLVCVIHPEPDKP